MKESYGSMWTLGLVLTFTLMFSAFLILMLNYSRVFKNKNEAIRILEKYEGFTVESKQIIDNYLTASNYSAKGFCRDGYSAIPEMDGSNNATTAAGTRAYYCVKRSHENGTYHLELFYKFNLPVFGDLTTFYIAGESNKIQVSSNGNYIIN